MLLGVSGAALGEVHSLTLQQAVDLALKENPDLVLSRLDQLKADSAIRVAKDPFVPKVYAGSGLAKVFGYPTSIEGSAPSIIQARTDMALYNRPKTYELARVRETARGAEIDTQSKSDQIAYQTATLFLDAQQMNRNQQSLRLEVESLERESSAVGLQVQEGRQLPIETKRIAVDLARANQRLTGSSGDLDYAEASLAVLLGYPRRRSRAAGRSGAGGFRGAGDGTSGYRAGAPKQQRCSQTGVAASGQGIRSERSPSGATAGDRSGGAI